MSISVMYLLPTRQYRVKEHQRDQHLEDENRPDYSSSQKAVHVSSSLWILLWLHLPIAKYPRLYNKELSWKISPRRLSHFSRTRRESDLSFV